MRTEPWNTRCERIRPEGYLKSFDKKMKQTRIAPLLPPLIVFARAGSAGDGKTQSLVEKAIQIVNRRLSWFRGD